jgi:hypothetical protein
MDGSQWIESTMDTQRSVASFMLRFTQDLWKDENGDPQVQWLGRINHVQGDEEVRFTDFTEALTFIQNQLQDLTHRAVPGATPAFREKALNESFKLWERFTADYTELVLKGMQDAFNRSRDIQDQVGDTFARSFEQWLPPGFRREASPARSEQEPHADLMSEIETLTAQVAALAAKIEALEK